MDYPVTADKADLRNFNFVKHEGLPQKYWSLNNYETMLNFMTQLGFESWTPRYQGPPL